MSSYKHFTLEEREYLQKLLAEKKSVRKIAAILGRSPSTISREIARNRTRKCPKHKPDNSYWYNHWRAQIQTIQRRRTSRRWRIQPGSEEWNFIINGLQHFWSPETICGRWHREHPDRKKLSASTIYRYVKQKRFPTITPKEHLRRRGKRLSPKSSKFNGVHPDRIIPEWPEEIRNRSRLGDWEGDTVYGGIGKGLLVTLVDRKSRYLCAGLLSSRDTGETNRVVAQLLQEKTVESISFDNGTEFSQFHALEERLHTLVYFAEPHKPWQRGTNENTNDILRFFFPKGFDFHSLSQDELDVAVDLINKRPRKCLNWLSPFEVFWGVALT